MSMQGETADRKGARRLPIELKDISYTYMPGTPYERKALQHVTLTIDDGTFVAIAGHTGSGKSTLLQHLNGLLTPTTGQVFVDGVDLSPKQRSEKLAALAARRSVGMVFQYAENQLFEETIYEDIAFGPRNFGCEEAEIDKRVRGAMALVNLDFATYKDRSPFQLSGGQMRRVALAGVLALQPRYLHLRHAKHPRRLLLRQRLEKAQQDRHALPLRQQVDRRAQGKLLDQALLRAFRAEKRFQR